MRYRAHFSTLPLAGMLILVLLGGVLLGGTGLGCAAGFVSAVYLPAAFLELPAPDLSQWRPADESPCSPLDTVLPAVPGRAPPASRA